MVCSRPPSNKKRSLLAGGRVRSSGLSLLNFKTRPLHAQHGLSFLLMLVAQALLAGCGGQRCRASTLPIREAGGSPVALDCRSVARRAKRDERCPWTGARVRPVARPVHLHGCWKATPPPRAIFSGPQRMDFWISVYQGGGSEAQAGGVNV